MFSFLNPEYVNTGIRKLVNQLKESSEMFKKHGLTIGAIVINSVFNVFIS